MKELHECYTDLEKVHDKLKREETWKSLERSVAKHDLESEKRINCVLRVRRSRNLEHARK